MPGIVLTIGHSTHPIAQFLAILNAHGITRVVDVRTMPRSRRNPQFNTETLSETLREAGIAYEHIPGLGGLRHARRDSVNTGWKNASFRGYADHMSSGEFQAGLQKPLECGPDDRTAIMCAEAVPWRCHRSMIADALTVRGVPVEHILNRDKTQPHRLTSFARIENNGSLIYPEAGTGELFTS